MDDENDLVMPHADSPYGYAARHAPRCGKDGRSDGAQGRGLYGKSGGGHKHRDATVLSEPSRRSASQRSEEVDSEGSTVGKDDTSTASVTFDFSDFGHCRVRHYCSRS